MAYELISQVCAPPLVIKFWYAIQERMFGTVGQLGLTRQKILLKQRSAVVPWIRAEVPDRVYVFKNRSALDMFKSARFELGPEVVLAAGPYGGGGITFSGMSWEAQATNASF